MAVVVVGRNLRWPKHLVKRPLEPVALYFCQLWSRLGYRGGNRGFPALRQKVFLSQRIIPAHHIGGRACLIDKVRIRRQIILHGNAYPLIRHGCGRPAIWINAVYFRIPLGAAGQGRIRTARADP